MRSYPLGELAACRCTGSVADYQERFLALLTRAGPLNESQQVQFFTAGLQEPLSIDVQLQGPQSLEIAMSLARSFEHREQAVATTAASSAPPSRSYHAPAQRGLLPPPAAGTPPTPPTQALAGQPNPPGLVTLAGRTVCRLTPEENDERRRTGQCFNCDDKYVRGHNRVCKRLFHLEIAEADDGMDTEDGMDDPKISMQLPVLRPPRRCRF